MILKVVPVPKLDKEFNVSQDGVVSLKINDTLKQDEKTGSLGVNRNDVFFQINRNYETQGGSFKVSKGLTTAPFDNPVIKKNEGGGEWRQNEHCYVVPKDGLYILKGAFRIADRTPSCNIFVNTLVYSGGKFDIDDGKWQSNNGFRYILDNIRIMHLRAGDKVYLQINATDNETGANTTISVYATDMTIASVG